jgi:hypothetical protein
VGCGRGEVWCSWTGVLGILTKQPFLGPTVSLLTIIYGVGTPCHGGLLVMVGSIGYYGKPLLFARICSFQNPANGETVMHNLRPYGKSWWFGGTEDAENIIYKDKTWCRGVCFLIAFLLCPFTSCLVPRQPLSSFFGHTHEAFFISLRKRTQLIPEMLAISRALALVLHLIVSLFFLLKQSTDLPTP